VQRLGYRPALDGLRGFAILCVLAGHTLGWPNGVIGVDVFFVLSGFLITVLLLEEWDETGSVSLSLFYRRRALRLLPALTAGLAVFLALSFLTFVLGDAKGLRSLHESLESALFGATYLANIVQAWNGWGAPGVRHLWSLAAEEQFYVVWPVTLLVLLRARVARRSIVIGLLAAIAAIAAHRLELSLAGARSLRLLLAPDTTFDLILTGCALGVAWNANILPRLLDSERFRKVLTPAAVYVILFALVATPWRSRALYDGLLVAVELSAAVVLLTAISDPASWIARALSRRWLVYVGRISYGLYVWHLIVMWGTPYVPGFVGVALSFGVAALSYRYLELPFLRRRRRRAAATPKAVAPAGALAVEST
jgi:peptidoglycan/LPS O-acetylase OafA/YrhL